MYDEIIYLQNKRGGLSSNNKGWFMTELALTTTYKVGIGTATPTEKLDVNGIIKGTGYKSSDGSAGLTQDIVFTDADSVQHTLNFKNGLLVGYTTV